MSDMTNQPRDLQSLIDRLLDDCITDDEVIDLNERIKDNPSAQKLLLEYCQFHSVLAFDFHAERVVDRLVEERERAPAAAIRHSLTQRISRRAKYAALLTLAGGVLLALGLPWFLRPDPIRFQVDASVAQPEVSAIKIDSGTTELKLAKVGTVFLQGPADFEMVGPMRARLNHGRIKVRVTDPRGHGFVVEMPNGEVTDLGTEFGVDVSKGGENGLVVFDGAVDLRVPAVSQVSTSVDHVERLVRGDGVVVSQGGQVDRIMAIYTGRNATFGQMADSISQAELPLIVDVKDNLRTGETRKFYEIVPRGLAEDALAYADRPVHEWNGVDEKGMPGYLIGADYVKPFNNDKMRTDFQLTLTLSRPAKLYVFFDKRIPAPDWLTENFKDTGDEIAIDVGPMMGRNGKLVDRPRGVGPGVDVDNNYSIWERTVSQAGAVTLGANAGKDIMTAMYGIAATGLDVKPKRRETTERSAEYDLVPLKDLAAIGGTREFITLRR